MANISILDTGFIKPTHVGSQLSTANRSNSGSLITLKGISFTPTSQANQDASPFLASTGEPEVNYGSNAGSKITIRGLLDLRNSSDVTLAYQLWRLPNTRGYKAVFYNVATSEAAAQDLKRDEQLVTMVSGSHVDSTEPQGDISFSTEYSGGTRSSQNLTNVYHIHVRFKSFTPRHTAESSVIQYDLIGEVTS